MTRTAPNFYAQAQAAEKLMAEYRRRLEAAGFIFGAGATYDCFEPGPGIDPKLANTIWQELTSQ